MPYDGVIDPDSSAALASTAAELAAAQAAAAGTSAAAAAGSATVAAASLVALTTQLKQAGVNYRVTGSVLQLMLPDGSYGAEIDTEGPQGEPGPAPTFLVRSVSIGSQPGFKLTADPTTPNQWLIDVVEVVGAAGSNGWTPVLGIAPNGQRRVEVVVDWIGGSGAKPATGLFVGPSGFTSDITAATDVRGAAGATGISGANFMAASTTPLAVALGQVSVVLTPATAAGFATCQYMALVSQADPRNAMAGLLQSYDPTSGTLTIAVLQCSGSGTHSDWIVTPSQVLTITSTVDDGFYDAATPSSSTTVTYVAVSPSASSDDDGTY